MHQRNHTANIGIDGHYRSIEDQNKLFAKVPKVTDARGGQSYHNYGLALDVYPIENGKILHGNHNSWNKLGEIGKELGFEWGGDFKSDIDKPHFQMRFDLDWKVYLQRVNNGATLYKAGKYPYITLP